jgi:hypothetical protein
LIKNLNYEEEIITHDHLIKNYGNVEYVVVSMIATCKKAIKIFGLA